MTLEANLKLIWWAFRENFEATNQIGEELLWIYLD